VKVYRDIEQGSEAWHAMRVGKATASCFDAVLAKGQGKMRANYLKRVIAETLTGKVMESYRNAHMDRGQEQEPLARWSYELATGNAVEQVSFIEHDSLDVGCSPDGLIVGKRRGAEIKCVIPTVQVETILAGGYPSEHKAQIQGSMWITGFEEWDFCSYSPDMPEHLRTYVFTVARDEAYIKALEAEVLRFLKDRDDALARLAPGGYDVEGLLRKSLEPA
jgi:hypothetical protein